MLSSVQVCPQAALRCLLSGLLEQLMVDALCSSLWISGSYSVTMVTIMYSVLVMPLVMGYVYHSVVYITAVT